MILIIAEKPAVARNIAAVVGAKKSGRYMEGGGYLVTSCVGHLCSLAEPSAYDSKWGGAWSLDALPIIPQKYQFVVSKHMQTQFALVKSLMDDGRITSIINACDGDREGENIFRLVYELAGCHKPVERLWVSSMEGPAIRDGMKRLCPMSEYDHLAAAAQCREIADWLIGMNCSRLYSCEYNANLSVGRVQTPTVNMVVKREQEIQGFVPVDYWIITANLGDFTVSLRCNDQEALQDICQRCTGANAVVSKVRTTDKTEKPPKLYNLDTLQQDCNRLFGSSPAQTLDALQNLYEDRLATYPRTSSEYLTEKDREMASAVVDALRAEFISSDIGTKPPDLDTVINDKKVEGHPALLPTVNALEKLSEQNTLEQQILVLLMYRLLEATAPARIYTSTKIEVEIEGYTFSGRGTVERFRGWKAVEDAKRRALKLSERPDEKKDTEHILPALLENDTRTVAGIDTVKKQSQPPQRFTEGTLVAAMATCGKELENEEQREAMKDCGLGTVATRAAILEKIIWTKDNPRGLITRGFLDAKTGKWSDTKHLYPTDSAMIFMRLLPQTLKDPATTGDWEYQLAAIQRGEGSAETFLTGMEGYVRNLVETSKRLYRPEDCANAFPEEQRRANSKDVICNCPMCGNGKIVSFWYQKDKAGNTLKHPRRVYHCDTKDCPLYLISPIAGRDISPAEVEQVMTEGITGWLDGFRSKTGTQFSSRLTLAKDNSGKLTGEIKFYNPRDTPLCACPLCAQPIVPFRYTGKDGIPQEGWRCSSRTCKLKSFYNPRNGRRFTSDEYKTLCTNGQTPTLTGFIGKNGDGFDAAIGLKRSNGTLTGEYEFIFPRRKKRR